MIQAGLIGVVGGLAKQGLHDSVVVVVVGFVSAIAHDLHQCALVQRTFGHTIAALHTFIHTLGAFIHLESTKRQHARTTPKLSPQRSKDFSIYPD